MGVDKSNVWCLNYVSTYTTDFFSELVGAFIKLFIFNWALDKTAFIPKLIIKLLSGNEAIGEFFTEWNNLNKGNINF